MALKHWNPFEWQRRSKEAARLAQADAMALIRDEGGQAYWEARRRERDPALHDGSTFAGRPSTHWRRVALIIAKRTGHEIGLDIATRMIGDRQ